MYSTKILYNLFLLGGVFSLVLGIYLKFSSKVSNANYEYSRYSVKKSYEFIDGNGTILLALLLLLSSSITFIVYKREMKRKIELKKKEDLENK